MPGEITKQFTFNNQAADIYPLTTTIISCVEGVVEINDDTRFKLKVILTELFTNSLKHAGGNPATMVIKISANALIVSKTDNGDPFVFNSNGVILRLPINYTDYHNVVFDIYGDTTCTLRCKLLSERAIRFFVEENANEDGHEEFKKHLSEHYGLIIITNAADKFEYEFDTSNGINKFMATIEISR